MVYVLPQLLQKKHVTEACLSVRELVSHDSLRPDSPQPENEAMTTSYLHHPNSTPSSYMHHTMSYRSLSYSRKAFLRLMFRGSLGFTFLQ